MLQTQFKSFQPHLLASDPGVREDLYQKSTASVLITDFFGNVPSVQLTNDPYDLTNAITVSDYFAERDEWDLKLPVFDGYKEHSDTTVELIKSDFESAVQQLNDRVMDLFNVVLARPDGSAGHEMISVKQVTDQDNIQLPPLQFVFGTFTLAMLLFTLSI